MSSQKKKSRKQSPSNKPSLTGKVIKIPRTKPFKYPPGVKKALESKGDKPQQIIQQLIWRDRRRQELDEYSTEELSKDLEKKLAAARKIGNLRLSKRIAAVQKTGSRSELIDLVLETELKDIIAKKKKLKEDVPYEEGMEFLRKAFPVPDQELADLLGLPKTEERMVEVPYKRFIIPGIEQVEIDEDDYIKVREVGGVILVADKVFAASTRPIDPSEDFRIELEDMDMSKLAEIVIEKDILLEGNLADYVDELLKVSDIKDPRKEIDELEQILEIPVDKVDDEEIRVRDAQEKRLAILRDNLAENIKEYQQRKEEGEEKLEKLVKKMKKKGFDIEDARKTLIEEIIKFEKERAAKARGEDPEAVAVEEEKRRISERANPFNKKYPLYARVQFATRDGEVLEGVIMAFAKPGIDVSVVSGSGAGKSTKIYKVSYKNSKLRVIKEKAKELPSAYLGAAQKYIDFEYKEPKVEDFYERDVDEKLRGVIRGFYESMLSRGEDGKVAATKKKVQHIGERSVCILRQPEKSWEEFINEKFDEWRFQIFLESSEDYFEQETKEKLRQKASEIAAKSRDEEKIIKEVVSLVEFSDQTTAEDFILTLRRARRLTPVHAYLLKNLELLAEPKVIRSDELAKIIQKSIDEYIRTIPSDADTEEAYRLLKRKIVKKSFDDYKKKAGVEATEKAKKVFLKKNEEILKLIYKDYKEMTNVEYQCTVKNEKEVDEATGEMVKRFENVAFETSSKTTKDYLQRVLLPAIFIEGPLSKVSRVFRAKLANGNYDFGSLSSANLAHYLPEFVVPNMHMKEYPEMLEIATSIIGQLLSSKMDFIIELYFANPTKRVSTKIGSGKDYLIAQPLVQMCKNVSKECESQSGTGIRPVVVDGKYVYERDRNGRRVMKKEIIPDGDVVICYDKEKRVFNCFDIKEVSRDIAKAKSKKIVNEDSGFVYPKDFIEKVKLRGIKYAIEEDEDEGETEVEDEDIIAPKKYVPVKRVRKVPIHKPSDKREDFRKIKRMMLIGEEFDLITLFYKTFDFQGAKGPREIPITTSPKDKADTIVLSFTVSEPHPVRAMEKIAKKIKDKGDLYIIGIGPSSKKDRTLLNEEIKGSKYLGNVKKIFYTNSFDIDDTEDTLLNVVIDVEGSRVLAEASSEEKEEWAYRVETPEMERKASRRAKAKALEEEERVKKEAKKKARAERKAEKKVVEKRVTPPKKKVRFVYEPPEYGQRAKFSEKEVAEIKKRWKKRKEGYTVEDIILQRLAEGKDIAKEEPIMRAALEGDAKGLERLLKTEGRDEEAVNAYKVVQGAGGDKEALKVLRNNYRIREAALDGDLEVLGYLLKYSDEPKLSSINLYKMAMDRGSDQSVMNMIKNDPLVRKFLRKEL